MNTGTCYSAFTVTRHSRSTQACFVLNSITQFYLPTTRFIPAKAEQDQEHYICNELLNVAAHFTDPERMEAGVELSVPGFEPRTSIKQPQELAPQPTELARQTCHAIKPYVHGIGIYLKVNERIYVTLIIKYIIMSFIVHALYGVRHNNMLNILLFINIVLNDVTAVSCSLQR